MAGKNKIIHRIWTDKVLFSLKRHRSVIILGPRQVGKTTFVRDILQHLDYKEFSLMDPAFYLQMEVNPASFVDIVRSLPVSTVIFIDEVQRLPDLLNSVQFLIDNFGYVFVITGSSARKLRKAGANMLAGRVDFYKMGPFLFEEIRDAVKDSFISFDIKNVLKWGSMPPVVLAENDLDRRDFLRSYSYVYLEQEVKAEALVRRLSFFSRFLHLAAIESGKIVNYSNIGREVGVSPMTVKQFFSVLEDTLIVERVEPFLWHARKRISHGVKFIFFDVGVRNVIADFWGEEGFLFEQRVISEIIQYLRLFRLGANVFYWRTKGGAEVDCVIRLDKEVIPVEIKLSSNVAASDLRGIKLFMKDYSKICKRGYVIYTGKEKMRLTDSVVALTLEDFLREVIVD